MVDKARKLLPVEFRDDATDLKREVDSSRFAVGSLKQEVISYQKTVEELPNQLSKISYHKKTDVNKISSLFKLYVKAAKAIDIVQQVLAVETTDLTTLWTVIDAAPFEDSLRMPVYEAQLNILRVTKEQIPLDFYVLNVTELSDKQELNKIIPTQARLLWER